MLKGNPKDFHWGREQDEAFEELKKRFTMAPILSEFPPRKKNGGRDRGKRLRARVSTIPIPGKRASPAGFSFSKVKHRGKKLPYR